MRQYTALALATAKAVRAADAQATILAPATSGFPWPFLESFLKSGVLEFLDGVSVHPYRSPNQSPETAAKEFRRLRELLATNTPPGRDKTIPIISGEWGYSSNVQGVSLETQAGFIVRQQLSNLLNGVPVSIWYDWKNDGDDPKENEHNFGTVRPDLQPKPAYAAIKIFTQQLAGFGLQTRYSTESTNDFVLVLTNAVGDTKLAAWTLNEPHKINLLLQPTFAKEMLLINGQGETNKIEITNSRMAMALSGAPRYLILGPAHLH